MPLEILTPVVNPLGFAAYPPKVEHVETLGYVEEVNGIFHSRDIGRSFELFDNVYINFGDTFCNDRNGEFVGLADNTVAIISKREDQSLVSKYLEFEETEMMKRFIPLTSEEQKLEKSNLGRVVLWAFGGVVVKKDGTGGTGRLWYQKSVDYGDGNLEYFGTGVAKVVKRYYGEFADDYPEEFTEQPVVERLDDLIFGPEEPRMGTFSAVADGNHIYLYGDRPDGKIILARVYNGGYESLLRDYHYWDGSGWVQEWEKAAVVIEGMQQGAIVRSKLFGDDRPFMFVGTSKWADSQVYMGASARLEGPWKLEPVCKVDGIKEPASKGKWMYCIYPQLWASDEEKAELVVTWSEPYPGGVIAGKLKLAGVVKR